MGLLIPARLSLEDTESILADKLRWILEASSPMAVIVFGSAARGEMTEASDLDLALLYADDDSLRKGRASILGRKPPDGWPLDLLFSTRKGYLAKAEKGGVFELIMREGRVIHGGIE